MDKGDLELTLADNMLLSTEHLRANFRYWQMAVLLPR